MLCIDTAYQIANFRIINLVLGPLLEDSQVDYIEGLALPNVPVNVEVFDGHGCIYAYPILLVA